MQNSNEAKLKVFPVRQLVPIWCRFNSINSTKKTASMSFMGRCEQIVWILSPCSSKLAYHLTLSPHLKNNTVEAAQQGTKMPPSKVVTFLSDDPMLKVSRCCPQRDNKPFVKRLIAAMYITAKQSAPTLLGHPVAVAGSSALMWLLNKEIIDSLLHILFLCSFPCSADSWV